MFEEFETTIATAEIDPRPRWIRLARQVSDQALTGIPESIAESIVQSRSKALAEKLRRAIEIGNFASGDDLIAGFHRELRDAVHWERTEGRLKVVTAETEIARSARTLVDHGWGSHECDALRLMLKAGERLGKIDYWKIVTSNREIGRAEVRAHNKPVTWLHPTSWEEQFVGDARVRELEADETERARLVSRRTSGPQPWGNGPRE
jgi:hypothetical protein